MYEFAPTEALYVCSCKKLQPLWNLMYSHTHKSIYCSSCAVLKMDMQTCVQNHYCNDKSLFTNNALKNRLKCTLCLSCPLCNFRLNSKEIVSKINNLDSIFTIYSCMNCGYDTSNFDFLKIEKGKKEEPKAIGNIQDTMKDKMKEYTSQKRLVYESLKMNDYDLFYRNTLDKIYLDLNKIQEFHSITDYIRNNSCTIIKIDEKNAVREDNILNQKLSIEDFGIFEDTSRKIIDAEEMNDNAAENKDLNVNINETTKYLNDLLKLDSDEYIDCKNKSDFDIMDFSSLYMDKCYAPNKLILTSKYLRPIRPPYEASIIKYENPIDGALLSSNSDEKIQKFNRYVPTLYLKECTQVNPNVYDVKIKLRSHTAEDDLKIWIKPIDKLDLDVSESQINSNITISNAGAEIIIPATSNQNLLKHNVNLAKFKDEDLIKGVEYRAFNYIIIKGTVVKKNTNESVLRFGIQICILSEQERTFETIFQHN